VTETTAQLLDESPREGGLARLELETWRETHGVVAGITLRTDNFDLALGDPRPTAQAQQRWLALLGQMRPAFAGCVVGRQVHGTAITAHRDPPDGLRIVNGVDGHSASTPGLLLAVTVADCVPVYLLHPVSKTGAILHAGWRGIAAGIVEQGIALLAAAASVKPADIVMHCGVSICGSCYEVSSEVHRAVTGQSVTAAAGLDLRSAIRNRALAQGVAHVTASNWCTAHHPQHFFSHRRSGGSDGRMAAYLGHPLA
jgi:YfiH family protein